MRRPAWLLCITLTACLDAADAPPLGPPEATTGETLPELDAAQLASLSLDSLDAVARGLYGAGDYARALDVFAEMRARARTTGSARAEASALTSMGLASFNLGDYESARAQGEEALDLKMEHRLEDLYARSYNALGLLAYYQNRFLDAQVLFRRTRESAEAVGDELSVGVAAGNLALVQVEWGQFASARENLLYQLRAGLDGAASDDPVVARRGRVAVGNAALNLGMLEVRTGNPDRAITLLDSALAIHRETGAAREEMGALGHLGAAYARRGDLGLALQVLDTALVIARTLGHRQEEASQYESMADIYLEAGDFRRTFELYERARAINDDLGLTLETGVDLRGAAGVRARMGDLDRAATLVAEALAIHEQVGAPVEEMRDRLLLAEIQDRRGDGGAATEQLLSARGLAEGLAGSVWQVEVALTQARIADRNGDSDAVLEALGRVERDLERSGYDTEWQARLLASKALARKGRAEEALDQARSAWSAVEAVRATFGSAALRTTFTADKGAVYAHVTRLLIEGDRPAEAFMASDAARGRTLSHDASQDDPDEQSAAHALLDEIDQLLETIRYLGVAPEYAEAGPRAPTGDEIREIGLLTARVAEARSEYARLLLQDGESVGLRGAVDPSAIRAALRPGQLLIEYLTPDEGPIIAFGVTPDTLLVVELPVDAQSLYGRVRVARDLIGTPDGGVARSLTVLAGLYEALVTPIRDRVEWSSLDEVVIVPHGVVTYLPFAALWDAEEGQYLVQDVDVRSLPTAASLVELARRSERPRVGGSAGFAPLPEELRFSSVELDALVEPTPVRRFEGGDATEGELRRALGTESLVHVATHGILNARNPLFSRLELARGYGTEGDGRLEVHEILELQVSARLVFISGCATALGPAGSTSFERGEDYATLAQAFLQRGAQYVIATLWPVEDRGSAAFAHDFYTALSDVAVPGPVAALASAQRSAIADPRYSAPYYWAGYRIAGWEG